MISWGGGHMLANDGGRGNGWQITYKWDSVDHDELQVTQTWLTGSSHGWRANDMKNVSGIGCWINVLGWQLDNWVGNRVLGGE